MASALKMKTVFAHTVAIATAFYSKAFGYNIRRLDGSNRWEELESGQTTIAFTPLRQHETDILTDKDLTFSVLLFCVVTKSMKSERTDNPCPILTGAVHTPTYGRERQPVEVCFAYRDVDAAYKRAVENGAVPVSEPEEREWGQKVGYVRDLDGIVVRLGSYNVNPPKKR